MKVEVDTTAVIAALDRAALVMRTSIVRQAVAHAIRPIESAAEKTAPQPGREGYYRRNRGVRPTYKQAKAQLAQTIDSVVRTYPSGVVVGVVGPSAAGGAHGYPLEYGHRVVVGGAIAKRRDEDLIAKLVAGEETAQTRRGINAWRTRRRRKGITGSKALTGRAIDYVPPHPFLSPAYESTKEEVTRRLQDKIKQLVEAEPWRA